MFQDELQQQKNIHLFQKRWDTLRETLTVMGFNNVAVVPIVSSIIKALEPTAEVVNIHGRYSLYSVPTCTVMQER